MKRADLVGSRFGRLVVEAFARSSPKGAVWTCLCDCGSRCHYSTYDLQRRRAPACPTCKHHGDVSPGEVAPEYSTWQGMKRRCFNPKDPSYFRYGGRGITVCDRWRFSYAAFLEDVGRKPSPKHSLDRYPNKNGNYEPGNVRWATPKEQYRNQNQRYDARMIEFDGRSQCIADWAREFGLTFGCLASRLNLGWPIEKALLHPVKRRSS